VAEERADAAPGTQVGSNLSPGAGPQNKTSFPELAKHDQRYFICIRCQQIFQLLNDQA
jgi:hypothetical protein